MSEDKNGHAQAQPPEYHAKYRLTLDDDAHAVYLYVNGEIENGTVAETREIFPNLNLDFDSNGKLLGIEILGEVFADEGDEMGEIEEHNLRSESYGQFGPAEQPAPPRLSQSICKTHQIPFVLRPAERGKTVEVCAECEKEQHANLRKVFPPIVYDPNLADQYTDCGKGMLDAQMKAGAEQPSAPPQPVEPTRTTGERRGKMITSRTIAAAEPSVEARNVADKVFQSCYHRNLGERPCKDCITKALAAAKREGLEEAARLAEKVEESGCQAKNCNHENGIAACIIETIRASKEQQNG